MGNPILATSPDPKVAAVKGENTGGGDGVVGSGRRGVVGESQRFQGVFGKSRDNAGVVGESDKFHGIFGNCHSQNGAGVFGANDAGNGVGFGVIGTCDLHIGVAGDSKTGTGVRGISQSADGVVGIGLRGVVGKSDTFQGVFGHSKANAGVVGESEEFDGVFGMSNKATAAGVSGHNSAGGVAGFFDGDVRITGVIHMTRADYAEDFTVTNPDGVEPGMVMVLDEIGGVRVSQEAYDTRVAGVVSGAGGYKPAVILDHDDALPNRWPLALMGKVYCKVDATDAPVRMGDLLTTSSVPGHAMKAVDPVRSFGSVIGKALQPLASGRDLVPILVRVP